MRAKSAPQIFSVHPVQTKSLFFVKRPKDLEEQKSDVSWEMCGLQSLCKDIRVSCKQYLHHFCPYGFQFC